MNKRPPDTTRRTSAAPRSGDARDSASTFDAFAIAAPGVAPLLARELRAIGVEPDDVTPAGVAFRGTHETLVRVNLWSRLATRVIVRLATFPARDFATLEKQAARVPWGRVMAPGVRVQFRVTCRKSRLYHSDAVAERVGRGVLGAVRGAELAGSTASDDEGGELEQLVIVRLEHDVCTISVDSSGALLHRRGWRLQTAKAPLRETLAAAMLAACDWNGDMPLVDPFCGSGTIGIEAALRARNMAPGLSRRFMLEQWPGVDAAFVTMARAEARAAMRPSVGVPIVMSDRDEGACAAARANAERAGVLADVEIGPAPLSAVELSQLGDHGLVLTNPPYGLRISEGHDLRNLYAKLGEVVRAGGRGWQLAMLIPDRKMAAPTKLTFETLLTTSNGGIGVRVERSMKPGAARDQRPPNA